MRNKTVVTVIAVFILFLALPLMVRAFRPRTVPPEVAVVEEEAPPSQPSSRRRSTMTEMQLSQVRPGMTYEQCVELIGCEGVPSGVDPGGGQKYCWRIVEPSGEVGGGEATLTFQNGTLCGSGFNRTAGRHASQPMTMSQALPAQRRASPPYVCRSVYDAIKEGCEYAECARLLGMDGTHLGQRAASMGTRSLDGTLTPAIVDAYVWQDAAIRATLSFRDGKLVAREISTWAAAAGSM